MIYFIGNEHGAIKIGYTATKSGVQGRLGNLQSASADQLTILAYGDGTRIDEGNLHIRFARLRIRGEWFVADDELLGYIFSLPTTDMDAYLDWIAVILPKGNTTDLQQLLKDTKQSNKAHDKAKNVLDEAKKHAKDIIKMARTEADKQTQDIIRTAHVRANQIMDHAINCAASDIKELIADSCDPPMSGYLCCKCGRARNTVKERGDGFAWCNPCWVNHAIFDSGRFDAITTQANDTVQCERIHRVM